MNSGELKLWKQKGWKKLEQISLSKKKKKYRKIWEKIQQNSRTHPGDPNNQSFRETEWKLSRSDLGNPLKLRAIQFEIERALPVSSTMKENRPMLSFTSLKTWRNLEVKKILQFLGRRKTELFPRLERHWLHLPVKCLQNAERNWKTWFPT